MCLFQSRPTRRSKLSQQFEGAASLPSLETPTPTSVLLLPWYSLLWLSATPNQVCIACIACCCMGDLLLQGTGSSPGPNPSNPSSSPLHLDLKSCVCVWQTPEMNSKVSVCRNCGSNICFPAQGDAQAALLCTFLYKPLDSDGICHLLL